jgi:aryl-alcohol dehydrogenase-like predicted oxidoreductase
VNYRLLGNSGLRVAEMSLGTVTFGKDWEGIIQSVYKNNVKGS